jgi:hypothetical protein
MTLWQRFYRWLFPEKPPEPIEQLIYNPLKARLLDTSAVTINALDFSNFIFKVLKMIEHKLSFKDQTMVFTDYLCKSTLQEGDPVEVKLRVYPHDAPGRELQVLVLKKWDELDYDEDFKAVLEDQQFNTHLNDELEASFWRINDVKTPYQSEATEVFNINGNVKTNTGEVWYWDYWRDTADVAGTPYKEFLFVEWDKGDTGRFTIWRGEEVTQSQISA